MSRERIDILGAALCALGVVLATSCSFYGYDVTVLRTYQGPDRSREEYALLIEDRLDLLELRQLDGIPLYKEGGYSFSSRSDKTKVYKDVVFTGYGGSQYHIFELEPGVHSVLLIPQAINVKGDPCTLRFEAHAGHVYSIIFELEDTYSSEKRVFPGIFDVTGGGFQKVSEVVY